MSKSGIGQSDTKWLKSAGECLPAPGGKASGAADRGTGPWERWIISIRRR